MLLAGSGKVLLTHKGSIKLNVVRRRHERIATPAEQAQYLEAAQPHAEQTEPAQPLAEQTENVQPAGKQAEVDQPRVYSTTKAARKKRKQSLSEEFRELDRTLDRLAKQKKARERKSCC